MIIEVSILPTIIISLFFSFLIIIFAVSSIISYFEHEAKAANKLLILLIPIIIVGYFAIFKDFNFKTILAIVLILLAAIILYYLIKKPIKVVGYSHNIPQNRIDEHDVIFARMRLKPNTDDWNNYYSTHRYEEEQDNKARSMAGLLSKSSLYYNPLTYNTANTNFDIIEYLQKAIKHPVSDKKIEIDQQKLTEYIKNWTKYLGAHSVGITELRDYHLYSYRGRGEDKGKPVIKSHKYAIAFTVEMDFDNVSAAPASPIICESTQKYLDCATIALQIATFLKNAGHDSRAHIDGDYELICPLVARDAGLGEIGRMGLLMTPELGPRVRIAVVTTNAPLLPDQFVLEPTMIEFCTYCKKCADCCPGKALPSGAMEENNGVKRWKVNTEMCYQYWCVSGTDCGRCISVCPFSHPNNILHNVIRRLIRRSYIMARIAYIADDILYDRKPKPKPIAKWMKVN
ncbi:MAG TPA: hypothetical protein DIW31_06755 [Bacteroidales bacterium]|nr:hypothetical protein [Bacteroidales bacterium]